MTTTPPLTQQQTEALRPLAALIETAIRETPIRLDADHPATALGGRLLADVAAYMGRTLGPDAAVLAEVQAERERQDAKWGEQNHPDGTGGSGALYVADRYRSIVDEALKTGSVTWRDVLLEEVYEALAERDPNRLRTELAQVAALAVAWIAAIDRRTA
ncbi:NUDIX hydrolase [Streptomyces sp. NPDC005302]|uniref:NUDIX hydrolase n=1 Tax=Streptomyces sp. NPDC005302 TaxID=3154675 RepID=UPI00339ED8BD